MVDHELTVGPPVDFSSFCRKCTKSLQNALFTSRYQSATQSNFIHQYKTWIKDTKQLSDQHFYSYQKPNLCVNHIQISPPLHTVSPKYIFTLFFFKNRSPLGSQTRHATLYHQNTVSLNFVKKSTSRPQLRHVTLQLHIYRCITKTQFHSIQQKDHFEVRIRHIILYHMCFTHCIIIVSSLYHMCITTISHSV